MQIEESIFVNPKILIHSGATYQFQGLLLFSRAYWVYILTCFWPCLIYHIFFLEQTANQRTKIGEVFFSLDSFYYVLSWSYNVNICFFFVFLNLSAFSSSHILYFRILDDIFLIYEMLISYLISRDRWFFSFLFPHYLWSYMWFDGILPHQCANIVWCCVSWSEVFLFFSLE